MTERIELRRTMNWPPKAGEWIEMTRDGAQSITFRCGGCNELASLEDHTIHADGLVFPSVVCPYGDEGCGWHVYLKLLNYNNGE